MINALQVVDNTDKKGTEVESTVYEDEDDEGLDEMEDDEDAEFGEDEDEELEEGEMDEEFDEGDEEEDDAPKNKKTRKD